MVEDKSEISRNPDVIDWYQESASRTAAPLGKEYGRLEEVHYAMGIVTEAGELMDIYKKNLAYGKPIDRAHIKEELGDLEWYLTNLYRVLQIDRASVLNDNIKKLKIRFPEKFDANKAINRDRVSENEILKKTNAED